MFKASYANGVTDEFIVPSLVVPEGEEPATIESGDAVIYFHFRSDRGRELTRAITDDPFDKFDRGAALHDLLLVTLTLYSSDSNVHIA